MTDTILRLIWNYHKLTDIILSTEHKVRLIYSTINKNKLRQAIRKLNAWNPHQIQSRTSAFVEPYLQYFKIWKVPDEVAHQTATQSGDAPRTTSHTSAFYGIASRQSIHSFTICEKINAIMKRFVIVFGAVHNSMFQFYFWETLAFTVLCKRLPYWHSGNSLFLYSH